MQDDCKTFDESLQIERMLTRRRTIWDRRSRSVNDDTNSPVPSNTPPFSLNTPPISPNTPPLSPNTPPLSPNTPPFRETSTPVELSRTVIEENWATESETSNDEPATVTEVFKTVTKLNDSVTRNVEQLQMAMRSLTHEVILHSHSYFEIRRASVRAIRLVRNTTIHDDVTSYCDGE